jgi:hypothetical protein
VEVEAYRPRLPPWAAWRFSVDAMRPHHMAMVDYRSYQSGTAGEAMLVPGCDLDYG